MAETRVNEYNGTDGVGKWLDLGGCLNKLRETSNGRKWKSCYGGELESRKTRMHLQQWMMDDLLGVWKLGQGLPAG